MIQQKEILEWLQQFNVSQIKHFLTIKNEANIHYVKNILTYNKNNNPIQMMQHGYSQTTLNEDTSLYVRNNFRYKTRKTQKKEMDQLLLQNLTVSRMNPYSLSRQTKRMHDDSIRQPALQLHISEVSDRGQLESIWFKTKNISSFSQWLVHLFEKQIYEAYHTKTHFVEEQISLQVVKEQIKNTIQRAVQRTAKMKKKDKEKEKEKEKEEQDDIVVGSKEQGAFLNQKCLEKMEGERDLGEIVAEYEWATGDRSNKIYRVIEEVCFKNYNKYENHLIDLRAQQVEEITLKKKKKKIKKSKEVKDTAQQKVEEQVEKVQKEVKEVQKQKQSKADVSDEKEEQSSQKLQKIEKKQTPKKSKMIKSNSFKNHQRQSNIDSCLQVKLDYKNDPKSQFKQPKSQFPFNEQKQDVMINNLGTKIVQKSSLTQKQKQQNFNQQIERINEHINSFYLQLRQASLAQQKHRKISFQYIFQAIQQLQLKGKWQLCLIGSASIDFAIKQSDLDIVLIIEHQSQCNLKKLQWLFKPRPWLRQCQVLYAAVPILQFQIILSQLKYPKIKDNNKYTGIINVDISISASKHYQGLKNTQQLRQIFTMHPELKIICLVFKQLLRIYELNKPYTGGISSYILVIMCYNLLKKHKGNIDGDFFGQIMFISKFMAFQFIPYVTMITCHPQSTLKPDPNTILNIQDPHEHTLLNTKAWKIDQLKDFFKHFYMTLQKIQQQMATVGVQQRKKLKRVFFQNWNTMFKPQTSQ